MLKFIQRVGRLLGFVLLCSAAAPSFAVAQEVKTSLSASDFGDIYFVSGNRRTTYAQFYKRTVVLDENIKGNLSFPKNMQPGTKVPAMVIMHSSSGITDAVADWAKFYNDMGIATFVVDSFGPRGFTRTAEDQTLMSFPASATDALTALRLIATHPAIDASKIGVTGYSRGAHAGLLASIERIRSSIITDSTQFAVAALFYPTCSMHGKTTSAPIRIYEGTRDAYNDITACRQNVAALKADGADVEMTEYDGGMHGFDTKNGMVLNRFGETWHDCPIGTIDLDNGTATLADGRHMSGAAFSKMKNGCMKRGITVGGNPKYREQSREAVKALLQKQFDLNGQGG
jgi:dienelactone hydrolase